LRNYRCGRIIKISIMKQRESGFTVVELLITIAMCGIIIPSLSLGLIALTVYNNRARDLALVNMLAQNKVELLRSSGFNSLSDGSTDFSGELPNTLSTPKSATYTISSEAVNVKKIQVSITYRDYNSPRTVQYESLISELGLGQ
jgi:type II secretory pathway pseudopilin PulG